MKKALITGITGQDGSYLAELLLNLGYRVHGLLRPETLSEPKNNMWRIEHIRDHLVLHPGSLQDFLFLLDLFAELKPQECYHLASQSFVNHTFDEEITTMTTNVNGTLHVLSALKTSSPDCRLFFPGSSEMFGKVDVSPQSELTPFRPISVYGISKTCGYDLMRHYRETHNIFTTSAILYNHESPRRGDRFVTRKIASTAAKIKLGMANEIRLGNIDAKRDWGHAEDYVRAMHMMLNTETPEDYVIASGKSHSVKEFLEIAFGELDLDYKKYLVIDPDLIRGNDSIELVGDTKKAWTHLGWKANISFEDMVRKMVVSDLENLKKSI
jgi:GDPmannose 4,6-dehydratase